MPVSKYCLSFGRWQLAPSQASLMNPWKNRWRYIEAAHSEHCGLKAVYIYLNKRIAYLDHCSKHRWWHKILCAQTNNEAHH